MKPYIITVAYDGTDFHGWQEQKQDPTIAGALQHSFKHVFGREIKTVGASRTDAGVHALGQVARFYTDLDLDCATMQRSWNGALPESIAIRTLRACPQGFHPQHNVARKVYEYYFSVRRPLPFVSRYVQYASYPIDFAKLCACLQLFQGEHDFSAFCTGTCEKGTVCLVDSMFLEYLGAFDLYRISVIGKRFLHHMVRRMVGASIKIASSDRSPAEIVHALRSGVCETDLPTAGAKGLLLRRIVYTSLSE